MKNQELVKIAQVGCGYWGPNLGRNVVSNPHAELTALCDPDARALQRMADKYPGNSPIYFLRGRVNANINRCGHHCNTIRTALSTCFSCIAGRETCPG